MTAPNPQASMPATTLDVRYRMGPLFTDTPGVDFWWNTQLDDGSYTICGEPDGWESVDYILPLDQVGGRDGAHTGPQSVGPRELSCSALVVAPNSQVLRSTLARIRRIFGPQGVSGVRQPVIWEQHDYATGLRLALVTRPSGRLLQRVPAGHVRGGSAVKIDFTLIAANPPLKYQSGAAQWAEVGLPDASALTGRTYDKTYDWTYGGGVNPGGELIATNNGDSLAWPVFTVTGPANFPIITNATTGRTFQILYDIPAGQSVTVNSTTGQVTPASVRLSGRPFPLVDGPNVIRWRVIDAVYDPDARLRLEWRSTFS
jgi:hypothetical protein